MSTTKAPRNGVSRNSTAVARSGPVEIRVDLLRRLQVLQLFQSREGAELVRLRLHLDALEQLAQLTRSITRCVLADEARQLAVDAIEIDAVTARVAARSTHGDFAAGKFAGNDLRQLAHAVVVGVLTDVEYLAAN